MSYLGYSWTEDGHNYIDPDAPTAGPSMSQDWYVNPASEVEGYSGQHGHEWCVGQDEYDGCTLVGASGNQFVGPYAVHPGIYSSAELSELLCFDCSSIRC